MPFSLAKIKRKIKKTFRWLKRSKVAKGARGAPSIIPPPGVTSPGVLNAEHSTPIAKNLSKPHTPHAVYKPPGPVEIPEVNDSSSTIHEARNDAAVNSTQANTPIPTAAAPGAGSDNAANASVCNGSARSCDPTDGRGTSSPTTFIGAHSTSGFSNEAKEISFIHSTVRLHAESVCSTSEVQRTTSGESTDEACRPDDLCKRQHFPSGDSNVRGDSQPYATGTALVSRRAPRKFHQSAGRFQAAERVRAVLTGPTQSLTAPAAKSTLITKSFVSYKVVPSACESPSVESYPDSQMKELIQAGITAETGVTKVTFCTCCGNPIALCTADEDENCHNLVARVPLQNLSASNVESIITVSNAVSNLELAKTRLATPSQRGTVEKNASANNSKVRGVDIGNAKWVRRSAVNPTSHPHTPVRHNRGPPRHGQACQFPDFCTQPCCVLYRLVTPDVSPKIPLDDPFEALTSGPTGRAKQGIPHFIRRPNCGCGTATSLHGPCCVLDYRRVGAIDVSPTPDGDDEQRVRRIQDVDDEQKDCLEMDAKEEQGALQRIRETNATMAALLAQLRAADYNK